MKLGYTLSSEEHAPNDLVRHAAMAEEAGFAFASISDHYHPWVDEQGHSPFVWSVLGGIAQATERIVVGTGVTCPTLRIHPAIIAQAAATAECMMPGRFYLGVGSGENLNEHIIGEGWPETGIRQEMLEEAIDIIRHLWEGGYQSYYGEFFAVENARIYTMPDSPPPIHVAASGPKAAELAGRTGDGLISVATNSELVQTFEEAGGNDKPKYAQFHVCWAKTEDEGVQTALRVWPNAATPGALSAELPLPSHFKAAAELVREDDIAKQVVCGPDPDRQAAKIKEYTDAGFDHIYVHQIGPNQEEFIDFFKREVMPGLDVETLAEVLAR
ncbi:MAG TPA: TIGR03557 family F420-dependent LLM class oxidoreductase [Dehalococcoidia bacterium]|nr:TIGR03557 family F420-dependent LLM class oxidoreductase [Dehalococcoidia bacterium]